jgi:hypothetical protein
MKLSIMLRYGGAGNHRNLSSVGTNVLAELDYEADACAVLILNWLLLVERLARHPKSR